MARRPRRQDRDAKSPRAAADEADQTSLVDDLLRALREVFTIPGVDRIGQPVTVLSPADLPPDFLGFVERLRAGAIEEDEELVVVTIPAPRGRRREGHDAADRLRQALSLLCRHALDRRVPAEDVMALLDEAKRSVGAGRSSRGGRTRGDADPSTGTSSPPQGDD